MEHLIEYSEHLTEDSEYLTEFDFILNVFLLSCSRSEEKLNKCLDPTVLPESIGKMMEILNNIVSVDAL